MKILNKVPCPPSYIKRHNDIVEVKKDALVKASLQVLQSSVTLRYRSFQSAARQGNLHLLSEDPILRKKKDQFLSCYKNKTKKTLAIFTEIENAQLDGALAKCPYCGITRPSSYDHYMPEEYFPELAVHALNLIPCCTLCNSSKGATFLVANRRQYLHFYSDNIPSELFLFAEVTTRPNTVAYAVSFRIEKPNMFSSRDWILIETHYRRLKLLTKYKNEANDEISTIFSSCKAHMKDRGGSVLSFLTDICDDEAEQLGENHWRVVLKRTLAITPEFVHYVIAEATKARSHA